MIANFIQFSEFVSSSAVTVTCPALKGTSSVVYPTDLITNTRPYPEPGALPFIGLGHLMQCVVLRQQLPDGIALSPLCNLPGLNNTVALKNSKANVK